jgi:hypothetical protein
MQGQEGGTILHPAAELPTLREPGKGLGFVFMSDEQLYMRMVRGLYPRGKLGEVKSQSEVHLFYTYVVPSSSRAVWAAGEIHALRPA